MKTFSIASDRYALSNGQVLEFGEAADDYGICTFAISAPDGKPLALFHFNRNGLPTETQPVLPEPVVVVPTEAPTNVDVPYASLEDGVASVTMGNWTGEPDTYAYQWAIDGVDAGDGTEIYTATVDDVGKTATCVVSATNDLGTTEAPPSNAVVVADIAVADAEVLEDEELEEKS
jgi:hypothetical protein